MTKTIKNTLFATTFLAMGAAGVATSMAATQGTTGPTSTGDLVVSLIVDNKLKVSNLDDTALGTFNGADLSATETICVYYNQVAPYQITFDSNDTPGTFELSDGVNTIPYSFTYADPINPADPVVAGTPITGRSTDGNNAVAAADDDCATTGVDNGTLDFTALATDITGNPNGTYSETIDITIAPSI